MGIHRRSAAPRRLLAGAALAGLSTLAQAGVFVCIEGAAADCTSATAGLSWTWDGTDFRVDNAGGGYVSEVYFDIADGMSVSFLGGSAGVLFTAGAKPTSLPGGKALGFVADSSFDADTQGPVSNGIGAAQWAAFRIDGAAPDSFDLGGPLATGLHLRGLSGGGASLLTTAAAAPADAAIAVSEPPALAMALTGFLMLGWSLRRRGKA